MQRDAFMELNNNIIVFISQVITKPLKGELKKKQLKSWKILSIGELCRTTSSCWKISEGQEKYLRELSITPVGYFNHSRGVLHGSYKKLLPCGVTQELFCMVKMRYFRGTGMIFPRLICNLRAYGALFCNWK
jgi:hypothetical protein